ncbi:hypothetical protein PDJAM_G00012310, partial [Pangasius djambal]|nr:hypothetical protein [Pangasius djambal]
ETSNKLLERWETAFQQKIINEGQSLTSTAEIRSLISAAEGQGSENDWDSDMSSVLHLLHLLPPPPGKKKTKISSAEAVERFVNFHKFFICVLINPAPVLKALSVGGRVTSHTYWHLEDSRARLTNSMWLW